MSFKESNEVSIEIEISNSNKDWNKGVLRRAEAIAENGSKKIWAQNWCGIGSITSLRAG